MLKWANAITSGRLLASTTWKEAFTPKKNGYGYGFQVGSYQNKQFIRHAGGYPGYVSEYLYYPKEDVIILLLTNSGNYGEDLWPISSDISKIAFGLPSELWRDVSPVDLPLNQLKEKEGTYTFKKMKLRFYLKDGQLYLVNTQGQEIQLFAADENLFYSRIFYTEFQFVKDSTGKVVKVITHERGVADNYEWRKE